MGLLEIIRHAGDGDDDTLYESGDCGVTVGLDLDDCPKCGLTTNPA